MIALIAAAFVTGYLLITLEHVLHIDKASSALVTGVLCWVIYILFSSDKHIVTQELQENLSDVSGIIFFLLGAMTIVELVDSYEGFTIITDRIKQTNKIKLLWIITTLTFFLSPLLDNLTTTIVVISLLRKLIQNVKDRLIFAGVVVIAANAGGAWSPIGDVTTTMLWLGDQISASGVITNLFIPSLVCVLVPLVILSFKLKGSVSQTTHVESGSYKNSSRKHIVFFAGVGVLLFVPVFKTVTHLPPYMGMLIGLGFLWMLTEIIRGKASSEEESSLSVSYALRKIDTPSILFFLGILLSIGALQSAGILQTVASWMTNVFKDLNTFVLSIGLLSAIVDNVPLVAASQAMFSIEQFPSDHFFWLFLAYATGTGGSALIIGSAAGVAAMGMEKISFLWYLKNISWLALIGYIFGALAFIIQFKITHTP